MKQLLQTPHMIFSAQNPRYEPKTHPASTEEVHQWLKDQGEDAHIVDGHYGSPEKSIAVFNPKNLHGLLTMAKDMGQESALLSNKGNHELRYMNGPNVGKSNFGSGTQFHTSPPGDFYTTIKHPHYGEATFTHNLDLSQLHDSTPIKEPKPEPTKMDKILQDEPELKKSRFDAQHVVNHINSIDPAGEGPRHILEQVSEVPAWEKKSIPINSILNHFDDPASRKMEGVNYGESDESVANQYSRMDTSAPPLVLANHDSGDYYTLDGAHRLRAAHLRGDTHVDAFVPAANQLKKRYYSNELHKPGVSLDDLAILLESPLDTDDHEEINISDYHTMNSATHRWGVK